jgi:uncharacterized membrane protein YhaH (DUF805 family)
MNFIHAVKICFLKYGNFSDRASRSEFLWFSLFVAIAKTILDFLDPLIAGVPFMEYDELFGPLSTIFSLAILVPFLSVTARRLHDVNRSGWWMFIYFTIVGIIPLSYWLFKKGDAGENRFGSSSFA